MKLFWHDATNQITLMSSRKILADIEHWGSAYQGFMNIAGIQLN
jgi:hypothetical protein